MIYKVSFVVIGRKGVMGGIENRDEPPRPGDRVKIGREMFEVVEVEELLPPFGDFAYLHATCKPVDKKG
jgi:hypothetical protein